MLTIGERIEGHEAIRRLAEYEYVLLVSFKESLVLKYNGEDLLTIDANNRPEGDELSNLGMPVWSNNLKLCLLDLIDKHSKHIFYSTEVVKPAQYLVEQAGEFCVKFVKDGVEFYARLNAHTIDLEFITAKATCLGENGFPVPLEGRGDYVQVTDKLDSIRSNILEFGTPLSKQ